MTALRSQLDERKLHRALSVPQHEVFLGAVGAILEATSGLYALEQSGLLVRRDGRWQRLPLPAGFG